MHQHNAPACLYYVLKANIHVVSQNRCESSDAGTGGGLEGRAGGVMADTY